MFFMTLILTVSVIGLIGNILVIIVYLFDKSLKSSVNYFFINLSITDILILIATVPVGLGDSIYEGEWIFGYFVCK
jgi:hypothetical protein